MMIFDAIVLSLNGGWFAYLFIEYAIAPYIRCLRYKRFINKYFDNVEVVKKKYAHSFDCDDEHYEFSLQLTDTTRLAWRFMGDGELTGNVTIREHTTDGFTTNIIPINTRKFFRQFLQDVSAEEFVLQKMVL